MATSKKGIYRVLLANSGTLKTTPVNLVSLGSRKSGTLVISPFQTSEDTDGRKIRNMLNFNNKIVSRQIRVGDLNNLISFLQAGAFDAQVVLVNQGGGATSGGVFEWDSSNPIGLDFDFIMAHDARECEVTLETARPFLEAKDIIEKSDDAPSLTPNISGISGMGGNEKGINMDKVNSPWFFEISAPDGSDIFNPREIVARKFSIKTEGTKNQFNETDVDNLYVTMEITGKNASIDKMSSILSMAQSPSLTIKERTLLTEYEKISIPASYLSFEPSFELGDEKREAKIVFTGKIPLNEWNSSWATLVVE